MPPLRGPKQTIKGGFFSFRQKRQQQKCPQELRVLDENVRMYAGLDFMPSAGTVSFMREYFPPANGVSPTDEEYTNDLEKARTVFCAAFGPNSILKLDDPKYPTDAEFQELLKTALMRRFFTLRAQLIEMNTESPDSRIDERKQTYTHLLRLKTLIEAFEANKRDGEFVNGYDPSGRELSELADTNLTDETMKALLNKFIFLVLQTKRPLDNWKQNQGETDAQQIINDVNSIDLNAEEFTQFREEFKRESPESYPKFFKEYFERLNVNATEKKSVFIGLYNVLTRVVDRMKGAKIDVSAVEDPLRELETSDKSFEEKYRDILPQFETILDMLQARVEAVDAKEKSATQYASALGSSAEARLQNSAARIAELEAELARVKDARAVAGAQAAAASNETEEAKETNRTTLEAIDAMEAQIRAIQDALNTEQSKQQDSEKGRTESEQEVVGLRKTLAETLENLEKIRGEAEASKIEAEASKTASNGQIQTLQEQLREKDSALEEIKQKEAELTNAKNAASAALEAARKQYQKDLSNAQEECARRVAELNKTHATAIGQQKSQIDAALTAVAEFEAKLKSAETKASDVETVKSSLSQLEQQKEATLEALQSSQLKSAIAEIQTIQKEIEGIRKAKEELEALKRKQEKEIEDLKTQKAAAEAALAAERVEFAKQLQTKTDELSAAKKEGADALAAAASNFKQETERLTANFSVKEAEFKREIAEKASELEAVRRTAAEERASLEREKAELSAQLQAQAARFAGEIAAQKRKYEEALRIKDTNIQRLSTRVNELKAQLGRIQDEKSALEARLDEFENALKTKEDELAKEKDESARFESESQQKTQRINQLNAEATEARNELRAAQEELEACSAKETQLNSQIAEINGEKDAALAERDTLREGVSGLQRQKVALNAALAGRDRNEAALRQQIARLTGQVEGMRQTQALLPMLQTQALLEPPPYYGELAVARTRSESRRARLGSQAQTAGLLKTVYELAEKIRSDTLQESGVPPRLRQLLERMTPYIQEKGPQMNEICIAHYASTLFSAYLFQGNPAALSRIQTLADEFMKKQKIALGTLVDAIRQELDVFEGKGTRTEPTVLGQAFGEFLIAGYEDIEPFTRNLFMKGLPEYGTLGTGRLEIGISYATAFIFFIALSTRFFKTIQSKLSALGCPLQPARRPIARIQSGRNIAALEDEKPAITQKDDYAILNVLPSQPLGQIARMFQVQGAKLLRPDRTVEDVETFMRLKGAYERIRAKSLKRPVETLPIRSQRTLKDQTQRNIARSKALMSVPEEPIGATDTDRSESEDRRAIWRNKGAANYNQGIPRPTRKNGVQESAGQTRRRRYRAQGWNTRSIAAAASE